MACDGTPRSSCDQRCDVGESDWAGWNEPAEIVSASVKDAWRSQSLRLPALWPLALKRQQEDILHHERTTPHRRALLEP
jgi:hypothetical protein